MSTTADTTQLAEASDPTTSLQRLTELAKQGDKDTKKAVAANPNTPPELLSKLAEDFPGQVLQNPVLDLLLLEEPAFFENMPRASRIAIAESEYADVELLRQLGGSRSIHPRVRGAVASNPNTPEDLVRDLAGQAIAARAGAARNPKTPEELLRKLSEDDKEEVRLGCASNESTPEDILREFALEENLEFRRTIAKNRATPSDILEKLATSGDTATRQAALDNPSTPEEIVELIERATLKQNHFHAWTVFADPELPVDDAIKLADPDLGEFAAHLAAQHPQLPPELLETLADHPSSVVRYMVAANPETPAEILGHLATDDDPNVRRRLALSRTTPPNILEKLTKDPEEWVRHEALNNIETPGQQRFARRLPDDADNETAKAARARLIADDRPDEETPGDTEPEPSPPPIDDSYRPHAPKSGNAPPQGAAYTPSKPRPATNSGQMTAPPHQHTVHSSSQEEKGCGRAATVAAGIILFGGFFCCASGPIFAIFL